jgi:nucleoside-diphosphate-sugar epimerase
MTRPTKNSKILIIGGSGFLSGTIVLHAVLRGCRVWTITRGQRQMPTGAVNLIADRHQDSAFQQAIEAASAHWDMVIDCIAFTPKDIKQDIDVFRGRTDHLVFISTDFVYDPQHRQFPQTEETDHYDETGYGLQKRLSEKELVKSGGEISWTIVRPTHIYGPGSELGCLPAHSRDPNLIARMDAGERIKLVGGGYFLQQPILARDLADFVLDLQDNPRTYGQILNAAGPEVLESRQYYERIAQILGAEFRIEEVPVAPYLAENPLASSFLCHRFYEMGKAVELGIPLPVTPLTQGLQEQIEHLQKGKPV